MLTNVFFHGKVWNSILSWKTSQLLDHCPSDYPVVVFLPIDIHGNFILCSGNSRDMLNALQSDFYDVEDTTCDCVHMTFVLTL